MVTLEESSALLAKHRKLDRVLADLQQTLHRPRYAPRTFIKDVKAARACIPAEDEYISQRHLDVLAPHRCPPHALGLAQRVFDIPELLEAILDDLDLLELLQVQRVNQQFRDAVGSSTRFQRKMCLVRRSSTEFPQSLDTVELPGLSVTTILCFDPTNKVTIEFRLAPGLQPGSRFHRMQLALPPIIEVTVYTSCCFHYDEYEGLLPVPSFESIRNAKGVTIKDLLDEREATVARHVKCPYACPELLDERGDVKVKVWFRGEILLSENAPSVKAHVAEIEKRKESQKERKWKKAFARARMQAFHQEVPGPEFEEWRKTYDPADYEDDDSDY